MKIFSEKHQELKDFEEVVEYIEELKRNPS